MPIVKSGYLTVKLILAPQHANQVEALAHQPHLLKWALGHTHIVKLIYIHAPEVAVHV